MQFNEWLDTFIEEKGIDTGHVFTVSVDDFWQTHVIPLEVVLEAAKNTAPSEQDAIKDTLVRIDFINANPLPYFSFLAERLAENRS